MLRVECDLSDAPRPVSPQSGCLWAFHAERGTRGVFAHHSIENVTALGFLGMIGAEVLKSAPKVGAPMLSGKLFDAHIQD